MTTRIWSSTCAAIAFSLVAGLVAQSPSTSQTPTKNITVTGCIQKAAASPTGTAGATTTTSGANETKFLLTNAAMGTSASGTAGTSGTPPTTAVASEYRLDADDAKLTPHVGHKVEIAGTVDQPASATPPQAPAASAANAPKLKVDTVKMVSSTCP